MNVEQIVKSGIIMPQKAAEFAMRGVLLPGRVALFTAKAIGNALLQPPHVPELIQRHMADEAKHAQEKIRLAARFEDDSAVLLGEASMATALVTAERSPLVPPGVVASMVEHVNVEYFDPKSNPHVDTQIAVTAAEIVDRHSNR